jgi:hypothetical protein
MSDRVTPMARQDQILSIRPHGGWENQPKVKGDGDLPLFVCMTHLDINPPFVDMGAALLTEHQHGVPRRARIAIGDEPEIAGVDAARVDPATLGIERFTIGFRFVK